MIPAALSHYHAQDQPKRRQGRCLRWADEEGQPDRARKPTTPRDPRAFADRMRTTGDALTSTDTSQPGPGNRSHTGYDFQSSPARSAAEQSYARPSQKGSFYDDARNDRDMQSLLPPVLPIWANDGLSQPLARSDTALTAETSLEHKELAAALDSLRQLTLSRSQSHHHHLKRPLSEKLFSSQKLSKARLDLSILSAETQAQPLVSHRGSENGGWQNGGGGGGREVAAESQGQGGRAVAADAERGRGGGAKAAASSSSSSLLTVLHF